MTESKGMLREIEIRQRGKRRREIGDTLAGTFGGGRLVDEGARTWIFGFDW